MATIMTQPMFTAGDRIFSHYTMKWGTIHLKLHTVRGAKHGVTGSDLPDTTWYRINWDDGSSDMLDDAHGDWDMARIVPPLIAERYNYGSDPKGTCKFCGDPLPEDHVCERMHTQGVPVLEGRCDACGNHLNGDPDFCPACLADMKSKRS